MKEKSSRGRFSAGFVRDFVQPEIKFWLNKIYVEPSDGELELECERKRNMLASVNRTRRNFSSVSKNSFHDVVVAGKDVDKLMDILGDNLRHRKNIITEKKVRSSRFLDTDSDEQKIDWMQRHVKTMKFDLSDIQDRSFIELPKKEENHDTDDSSGVVSSSYIDQSRIAELRTLESSDFDLTKLVRFLEEINHSHEKSSLFSVLMLVRAVLDHVPPIFSCKDFSEVANNCAGTRSFKKSMSHLEGSCRNIADSYLHTPIRSKESLPNVVQVNFSNDIDVLLGEICRLVSK